MNLVQEREPQTPISKIGQVMGIIMELRRSLPEESPLRARATLGLELLAKLAKGHITLTEHHVIWSEFRSPRIPTTAEAEQQLAALGLDIRERALRLAALHALYDEWMLPQEINPAFWQAPPDVLATVQAMSFADYLLANPEEFAAKLKQIEQEQDDDETRDRGLY